MDAHGGDLSGGLARGREAVVMAPPTEAAWSENLLFALYDPGSDIGLWLHWGTVPTDWAFCEDWCLAMLPGGEGVASMTSYYRTPPPERPAGANLRLRCIEPFARWQVGFDGFMLVTPDAEMAAGRAREDLRQRMTIDLDVACRTPAWDAHRAAGHAGGQGTMRGQGWAKEHYEQLYTATGLVRLPSGERRFSGTGWRDHSRGPRGAGTGAPWGGHVIMGCLFPESGRAWGLSRYWTPAGEVSLEGGYVVGRDGRLEYAKVTEAPRLRGLEMKGEEIAIGLRTEEGAALRLRCATVRSLWLTMRKRAVGVDLEGLGLIYALNFARCEWDGETAYAYIERSDVLNAPLVELTGAAWQPPS